MFHQFLFSRFFSVLFFSQTDAYTDIVSDTRTYAGEDHLSRRQVLPMATAGPAYNAFHHRRDVISGPSTRTQCSNLQLDKVYRDVFGGGECGWARTLAAVVVISSNWYSADMPSWLPAYCVNPSDHTRGVETFRKVRRLPLSFTKFLLFHFPFPSLFVFALWPLHLPAVPRGPHRLASYGVWGALQEFYSRSGAKTQP